MRRLVCPLSVVGGGSGREGAERQLEGSRGRGGLRGAL